MRWFHVSAFAVVFALSACGKKEEPAKPEPKPTPSASAPPVETSTFTKKAPTAGMKADEVTKMKLSLTLDVDPTGAGKPITTQMDSHKNETREEEILAMNGDAITKMKVKYADLDESMSDGKKETKKPDPRAGKTYVVEAKDGKVMVTGDDGKPTVPAEASLIETDYKRLGKPDPVMAALPKGTLKPGEKVPELEAAIKDMLKEGEKDMDISDVSVTFKEKSGDDGVFNVTMTFGKTEPPMKMSIPLKGELHVRTADGGLSSMKLSGPVTVTSVEDPKSKMKMSGKGTMELEAARKMKS